MLNRCPACSTDSMPESTDSKQTFDHVVAFIDILGSSQILKSDDEKAISDYLEGIEGMYLHSRDVTEEVKMFSDNILIFSQGSTEEDVQSVISSVAQIQWAVMKDFNLFIRGGVVIGRLDKIPEESTDYIIGRAIVEAHELESTKAVYPRVLVDSEIARICSGPNSMIKDDWDCPFIDYLQVSMEEGFVSDGLEEYRQSLIMHIENNNRMKGCKSYEWDRIRDKDVWALSYFNDFCERNGCEESIIDFREYYDIPESRIAIRIEGREEVD